MADLHRKIGAALSHKGERKAAIEHYQKGINLLKDGPPRLELVRLYEEAAWLYLHTGDNMLAIYASEKALRLAERLGETRAASRAHGIFGRVFGRIGDTEKARENLERAVELARTRRSTGGGRLRARTTARRSWRCPRSAATSRSPRPTSAAARAAYEEALALAEQMGALPAQVELHASLAQLAVYGADWDAGRALDRGERRAGRARGARRQALPARSRCAACCAGARATSSEADRALPPRPRAGRAGRLVGARLPGAVRAGDLAARPGDLRRRAGRARPRARRLRARRPDRAVDPGDGGAGRGADARAPPRRGASRRAARRRSWPSACTTRSVARRRWRRRGRCAEDPAEAAAAARGGRARPGRELERPLEAARCAAAGRPGAGRRRRRARPAMLVEAAPRRSRRLGVRAPVRARAGRWRPARLY